jgi:hypothetical protein
MEIPILLNYALYRDTRRMKEFSASMHPDKTCRGGMHSMEERFYACSYGNIRKINHGALLCFVQAGQEPLHDRHRKTQMAYPHCM